MIPRNARYKRSAKGQAANKRYKRSPKGIAADTRYRQSEKGKMTAYRSSAGATLMLWSCSFADGCSFVRPHPDR
jgi:hypothetical protein